MSNWYKNSYLPVSVVFSLFFGLILFILPSSFKHIHRQASMHKYETHTLTHTMYEARFIP